MFKLKPFIKNKLYKLLELDFIYDKIVNIEQKQNKINTSIQQLKGDNDILHKKYNALYEINQLYDKIATDVRMGIDRNDQSWAVICFNRGKTPITKFIDLRGCDGYRVYETLKQFEACGKHIDTPYGYGYEFEKLFLKWDKNK